MKTKLPPMPLGGDSMLFGVKLTDEQTDRVFSALCSYQDELETDIKTETLQGNPDDMVTYYANCINEAEALKELCPDYVLAMYDQEENRLIATKQAHSASIASQVNITSKASIDKTEQRLNEQRQSKTSAPDVAKAGVAGMFAALRGTS